MSYVLKIVLIVTMFVVCFGIACARGDEIREVVVYTAVDQIFSEPILHDFEQKTGIRVKAVYDIEAVKTTGLVNRLIAEKNNPRCDVFWNNEIVRTILLKRKELLAPYHSPSAKDIPLHFKDKEGYWTGFAARARVIVVNTDLLSEQTMPSSLRDLLDPKWRGKTAIANPLFGTTATHFAALYHSWGSGEAERFLQQLKNNKARIVDGNSVVRDITASGEVLFGLTDTDDVNVGVENGMPIKAIFPDQGDEGTLLIPNTVALIRNSPHPQEGRLLIDYLLSIEVETELARSQSAQIPVRQQVIKPDNWISRQKIVFMKVDYEKAIDVMDDANRAVQKLILR